MNMPLGVIVNVLSVLVGGIIGALVKDHLSDHLKNNLTMIFGVCSFGMAIPSLTNMQNMPAVVFSVVVGTAIGLALHLGEKVQQFGAWMQKPVAWLTKGGSTMSEDDKNQMLTIVVLFCVSGTGIYGCLDSGMTGDHTILLSKSILDLFTALIFACQLGPVVSVIAVPQAIIFLIMFFAAGLIFPLTNPGMIADFKACGGFFLIATGFRMLKLRNLPVADMIPAMILVMPVSWFWQNVIVPFL